MIKTSEKITEIIKKVFEIQSQLTGIEKNSTNPFFKSSYTDLNTILTHLFPILKENKLILNQSSSQRDNYLDTVTRITDVISGEFMENSVSVPVGTMKAQEGGSSLTYSRRYGLMTLLSLKAEDDDGNAGSGKGKVTEKKSASQKVQEKFGGEDVTPVDYKKLMSELPKQIQEYLKAMKFSFKEICEWGDGHSWDVKAMTDEVNSA